ncbi:uncharacterized protein LOC143860435 [Tasmannia lanceolata]|uniref:uncharacterized protein LOC143860435 n=1 Tax=Tasmannia lanceolata TaxID=3420 RepID=UPI0040635EEF
MPSIVVPIFSSARSVSPFSFLKNQELLDVAWWNQFGNDVPDLQSFAVRILSQTCSATGCERNWSTFEHIHSARRNRLEHQRLNDLLFVYYNLKFRERDLNRRSSTSSDPVSIDHLDVMMDWIAEDEYVILTSDDIGWDADLLELLGPTTTTQTLKTLLLEMVVTAMMRATSRLSMILNHLIHHHADLDLEMI